MKPHYFQPAKVPDGSSPKGYFWVVAWAELEPVNPETGWIDPHPETGEEIHAYVQYFNTLQKAREWIRKQKKEEHD